MSSNATVRRRVLGAVCLIAALAMLVAGETLLKGRLSQGGLLAYWLICFFLTALAMLAALLDVRALLRRTGREHRELIENTIQEIESDARTGPRKPKT